MERAHVGNKVDGGSDGPETLWLRDVPCFTGQFDSVYLEGSVFNIQGRS